MKYIICFPLFVIMLLFLVSCSKDDSKEYDTEDYGVSIGNYGEDKYAREVNINDYSKAQKLKWKVFFQDQNSEYYFRIYPTEGTGSGKFIVRLKDPNNISYDCPIDIFFTKASGKTSSFSPHVSFYHLQSLYPF